MFNVVVMRAQTSFHEQGPCRKRRASARDATPPRAVLQTNVEPLVHAAPSSLASSLLRHQACASANSRARDSRARAAPPTPRKEHALSGSGSLASHL